jgi:hypothetical protein
MARIKLITDVSEIGLLQDLARTRARLVASTLVALAASYGLGFWSVHYIMEVSGSVVANMFLISANMLLVLIASFLLTALIGDLAFPGPWRETVFLEERQQEHRAPVRNHSGEFLVILMVAIVGNAYGLNVVTGGFIERYHTEGYFRTWLRAEAPETRGQAFEKLTQDTNFQLWTKPKVQQIVLDGFDDPAPEVRAWAAWSAGKMKVQRARPGLIELVESDSSGRVVADAAVALGKLGPDQEARRAIVDRLADADDPETTIGTLRGLGLMGAEQAVEPILPHIDADDEEVMTHAFWALRQIGSEKARDPVRAVIDEDPPLTRRCAAFDTLKKVATQKDMMWARRHYQRLDYEESCPLKVWTERDGSKHYIVLDDSFKEKVLKIVANEAAADYQDWFQRIINDPDANYRLREVANEVLRQLRNK